MSLRYCVSCRQPRNGERFRDIVVRNRRGVRKQPVCEACHAIKTQARASEAGRKVAA